MCKHVHEVYFVWFQFACFFVWLTLDFSFMCHQLIKRLLTGQETWDKFTLFYFPYQRYLVFDTRIYYTTTIQPLWNNNPMILNQNENSTIIHFVKRIDIIGTFWQFSSNFLMTACIRVDLYVPVLHPQVTLGSGN